MLPVEKMLARMKSDYQNSPTTGSVVAGALDELSQFSVPLGGVLIVFGILCGFFGKRLVKPVSFVTGALVGAGIALAIAVQRVKSATVAVALAPHKLGVIAGAGGLVVGVLTVAFYKAVIFGIVGLIVSAISLVLASEYALKIYATIPVGLVSFVAGTGLASLMPNFSTIIVTSCLGSYVLSVGIDCVIKSGFNHIFAFGLGYKWEEVQGNTSDEVFGLMAFWIIMFIWMGVRQILAKDPVKVKAKKAIEAAIDA